MGDDWDVHLGICLAVCGTVLMAAALIAVLLGGCNRPVAAPGTMPPVAQPGPQPDSDAGVDPGCAALCARCPQFGPDGGDCTTACDATLDAVDGMLDPACVTGAEDCGAALACVR